MRLDNNMLFLWNYYLGKVLLQMNIPLPEWNSHSQWVIAALNFMNCSLIMMLEIQPVFLNVLIHRWNIPEISMQLIACWDGFGLFRGRMDENLEGVF